MTARGPFHPASPPPRNVSCPHPPLSSCSPGAPSSQGGELTHFLRTVPSLTFSASYSPHAGGCFSPALSLQEPSGATSASTARSAGGSVSGRLGEVRTGWMALGTEGLWPRNPPRPPVPPRAVAEEPCEASRPTVQDLGSQAGPASAAAAWAPARPSQPHGPDSVTHSLSFFLSSASFSPA